MLLTKQNTATDTPESIIHLIPFGCGLILLTHIKPHKKERKEELLCLK
jgi:hypothetical protein